MIGILILRPIELLNLGFTSISIFVCMWVYLKSRNLLYMINIIFTCPHVIADGETLEHYVADVADLCQVLLCVTY